MLQNLIVASIFLPFLSFPFVVYFTSVNRMRKFYETRDTYWNETVYVEYAGVKVPLKRSEAVLWDSMDRTDKRDLANTIKNEVKKGALVWDGEQYLVTDKGTAKGIKAVR